MNKCHIFNIDNLLVQFEQRVWVVEKSNPNKCLFKIDKSDFDLIKNGVYRSQDLSIKFGDINYYVDSKFLEELNKKVKKDVKTDELTFSFREFVNPENVEKLDVSYDLTPANHIKNTNDWVFLITTKSVESKYKKYHNIIKDKLSERGIIVNQIYYLNQSHFAQNKDENIKKISNVIISNLLNKDIKNNELKEDLDRNFKEVHYYDNNYVILSKLEHQLNRFINELYSGEIIKKLFLNKVTSNLLNPIIFNEFKLLPKYIKTFESFNKNA